MGARSVTRRLRQAARPRARYREVAESRAQHRETAARGEAYQKPLVETRPLRVVLRQRHAGPPGGDLPAPARRADLRTSTTSGCWTIADHPELTADSRATRGSGSWSWSHRRTSRDGDIEVPRQQLDVPASSRSGPDRSTSTPGTASRSSTWASTSPDGGIVSRNIVRNFLNADYLLSAEPVHDRQMYRDAYRLQGIFPRCR